MEQETEHTGYNDGDVSEGVVPAGAARVGIRATHNRHACAPQHAVAIARRVVRSCGRSVGESGGGAICCTHTVWIVWLVMVWMALFETWHMKMRLHTTKNDEIK